MVLSSADGVLTVGGDRRWGGGPGAGQRCGTVRNCGRRVSGAGRVVLTARSRYTYAQR